MGIHERRLVEVSGPNRELRSDRLVWGPGGSEKLVRPGKHSIARRFICPETGRIREVWKGTDVRPRYPDRVGGRRARSRHRRNDHVRAEGRLPHGIGNFEWL